MVPPIIFSLDMAKKLTTEEFIEKSKNIFKDRFDYSKVKYVNEYTKITLICNICKDEFSVLPFAHLKSKGCPNCSGLKKWDTDKFIKKAKEVHGDKYNYDKTHYINKRTNVIITCPIHGDFIQNPHNHIQQHQGCPECGKKYAKEWSKGKYENFINESKKRFGDNYTFPNIETLYENSHSKILIQCSKCKNIFEKIACDHLTSPKGGCLHCYAQTSKDEDEILQFIKELIPNEEILNRTRSIIDKNELDIYIPQEKVGIEYDGIYWHSDAVKIDKNYHLKKTEACKKLGISLIHVFEDEYANHKEIVLSKLKHILKKDFNLPKIMGRNCTIKEIDYRLSKEFLDINHIQGSASSTVYLGCYYQNQLVGVMTFKKEGESKWELNRFASDINYRCIGIGGKLFSYFIKAYNPKEIKSFADRRWTVNEENNLYTQLGFQLNGYITPDYRYYRPKDGLIRQHKFNFRKQTLHKKYGLPLTMTENEMTKELGYYKVWDCGLLKYTWKK